MSEKLPLLRRVVGAGLLVGAVVSCGSDHTHNAIGTSVVVPVTRTAIDPGTTRYAMTIDGQIYDFSFSTVGTSDRLAPDFGTVEALACAKKKDIKEKYPRGRCDSAELTATLTPIKTEYEADKTKKKYDVEVVAAGDYRDKTEVSSHFPLSPAEPRSLACKGFARMLGDAVITDTLTDTGHYSTIEIGFTHQQRLEVGDQATVCTKS